MNQTTTTYRAVPRGVALFGFVLCAVLAVLFWSVGQQTWNSWIARTISVVCGLIALMLVFYKQVSIDTTHGVVRETTLLFGLLRVRRRDRRLSKFRAICCYVSNESEGGSQTWAVALDPESGYPLDLRYFSSPTARLEADEFAKELGRTTGLEVKHEAVKHLFGLHRIKRAKQ
jgi:hypothetical protein